MKKLLIKILLPIVVMMAANCLLAQNEIFTISFNREDFKIERSDDYSYLESGITGMYYKDGPGKPALPYLPVNFAVPYGSKFIDVSMSFDTVLIASDIVIQPMQPMIPMGIKTKKQKKAEPNKEI